MVDFSFSLNDRLTNMGKVLSTTFPQIVSLGGKSLIGIVASALSLLSLGSDPEINKYASSLTGKSATILTNLFESIMKVVNPNFKGRATFDNGFFFNKVTMQIHSLALQTSKSADFLKRHIVSRLGFAVYTVASVASRIADLALGIIGISLSVLTFGCVNDINNFAMSQLSFLGIIGNVCHGIRYVINPHQQIIQ